MQTQDGKPGEETRGGSWSVSDVGRPDPEPVHKAGPKTTASKRKATKKDDDAERKPPNKRKTSKTARDADEKPKTTAKRKTHKTAKDDVVKPKTTARRKASKTAKENDAKPKTTAKRKTSKAAKDDDAKPKTTAKRKTSKQGTGKTTTKRRSRRKQDLGDLISELLERRASGEKGTDSIVTAILEHLTRNMGLSTGAAEMVVSYILNKLVKSKQERAAAEQLGEAAAPGGGELDLGGFFQLTRSGQAIDVAPVVTSQELQELAQDAGLDPTTAEASLNHVLKILGEAAA